MKTETELTNLDLDVFNLLKDFPENDIDSVIYIRARKFENNRNVASMIAKSESSESLSAAILGAIGRSDKLKNGILISAFNYLIKNPLELKTFMHNIQRAL